MSLRYKIVFSVAIMHDYYTGKFCPDLDIIPSAATAAVLSGHGMVWKQAGHQLIVLTRVNDAGKPFVKLSTAVKLSFYLRINNPHFYNFTNLSYHPAEPLRYYFSNGNQTKIDTTLYLNTKIANYNNTREYPIGSFAASPAKDIYEAIKPSNSGSAHALTDAKYWTKHGKFQYVNAADLIQITPFVYQFKAAVAATNFNVKVFGFNAASGNYDTPVMDTVNLTFDSPQTLIPVRLETLPPGKYRLNVNGDDKLIYLDGDVVYRDVFGVLEIVNNLPAANDFALFDAAGKPKNKLFTLQFASRSVIWKYLARTSDVTTIEDTTDSIKFTSDTANQFTSDKPVPLQEKPLTTILLKSATLGDILPLANPGKDRLATIVRAGNTYLCSEMHLNY
jgi:hypothetical protein